MGLNISKGNMYEFVTHTWNTIKGECYHDCKYCYMKRFGKLNPVRFDKKELKTDLGQGNFIFVGSSNDIFSEKIPEEWIIRTLEYCNKFDNKYFIQTKNPGRIADSKKLRNLLYQRDYSICTTLESNIFYSGIMKNSPKPEQRAKAMGYLSQYIPTYVTIEPIMIFTLPIFVELISSCSPIQVNIGADTGENRLPEPTIEEIKSLVCALEKKGIVIHKKRNLGRLMKGE